MIVDQNYHLEPKKGLLNDPVGLVWFQNRYHVFFQWNSKAKDHTYKEWGHFSSGDLLQWTQHESPLQPSESYDQNGVYSGSCCVDPASDTLLAFYTGNRKENGIRTVHQCLATSRDGIHFEKKGPVLAVPSGYTQHFRDPRVFPTAEGFGMIIGAQNQAKEGCLLLFTSTDQEHWEFHHEVGRSKAYNMIECPELLQFPQGDVLMYCPQARDPMTDMCLESFSVYRKLDQDIFSTHGLDLDSDYLRLESGFDGYAAQVLKTPNRFLIYTWMNRLNPKQEQDLSEAAAHIHCLTLPRQLELNDRVLIQRPAPELYGLFEKEGIPLSNTLTLPSRALRIQIEPIDTSFELTLGDGELVVRWNKDTHLLELNRSWPGCPTEQRKIRLMTLDHLELFLDTSSAEIFANQGEAILSARLLPQEKQARLQLVRRSPASQLKGTVYLRNQVPLMIEENRTDSSPMKPSVSLTKEDLIQPSDLLGSSRIQNTTRRLQPSRPE